MKNIPRQISFTLYYRVRPQATEPKHIEAVLQKETTPITLSLHTWALEGKSDNYSNDILYSHTNQ